MRFLTKEENCRQETEKVMFSTVTTSSSPQDEPKGLEKKDNWIEFDHVNNAQTNLTSRVHFQDEHNSVNQLGNEIRLDHSTGPNVVVHSQNQNPVSNVDALPKYFDDYCDIPELEITQNVAFIPVGGIKPTNGRPKEARSFRRAFVTEKIGYITDAVSGKKHFHLMVGNASHEALFFKAVDVRGYGRSTPCMKRKTERGSGTDPMVLYFASPSEYEYFYKQKLSEETKKRWRKNYTEAIQRLSKPETATLSLSSSFVL